MIRNLLKKKKKTKKLQSHIWNTGILQKDMQSCRCYTLTGTAQPGFLVTSLWLGGPMFWMPNRHCWHVNVGNHVFKCISVWNHTDLCDVAKLQYVFIEHQGVIAKDQEKFLWVAVCAEQWMENSQWSLHGSLASFLWLNCRSGHLCWSVSHRSP